MKNIAFKIYILCILCCNCTNKFNDTAKFINNVKPNKVEPTALIEHKKSKVGGIGTNWSNFSTLKTLGSLFSTYFISNILPTSVKGEEFNFYSNENIVNDKTQYNNFNSRSLLDANVKVFCKNYSIDAPPLFELVINSFPASESSSYTDLTILNDRSIGVVEGRLNPILSPSFIGKLDKEGRFQWAEYLYNLEKSEFITIKRIVTASNQDFIFLGDSSYGIVYGRMNSDDGSLVWLNEITGIIQIENFGYSAEDLINTNDDKFALLGFLNSGLLNRRRLVSINPYSFLSKFDGNGTIIWSTEYLSNAWSVRTPRKLIQLSNGCYVTGGARDEAKFSKFDENGQYLFTKEINLNGVDVFRSYTSFNRFETQPRMVALDDSTFAMVGVTDYLGYPARPAQPYVTLLDSDCNVTWFKVLNFTIDNSSTSIFGGMTPLAMAVSKTPSSDILLAMTLREAFFTPTQRRRMAVLPSLDERNFVSYTKINSDCDIIFSKIIPFEKNISILASLESGSDYGIVMLGFNEDFDTRYLLKANPLGWLDQCVDDNFFDLIYLNASTEETQLGWDPIELIVENISTSIFDIDISDYSDRCSPTDSPTNSPTRFPGFIETDSPTNVPTPEPTPLPTDIPSFSQTDSPTTTTIIQTEAPAINTSIPTLAPQTEPTVQSDTEGAEDDGISELGIGLLIGLGVIVLIFIILCLMYCIPSKNYQIF